MVVDGPARAVAGFDSLLLTPADDEASLAVVVTDVWLGRKEFIDCDEDRFEG